MKKFILILFAVTTLFPACMSESKYHHRVHVTLERASIIAAVVSKEGEQIAKVWHDAIYENKMPNGDYCYDFNDALAYNRNALAGLDSTIESHCDTLRLLIKELKDYPDGCKEEYDDIVNIVADVIGYAELTTNTTGSLKSFTANRDKYEESIKTSIEKFQLKYPEVIEQGR